MFLTMICMERLMIDRQMEISDLYDISDNRPIID